MGYFRENYKFYAGPRTTYSGNWQRTARLENRTGSVGFCSVEARKLGNARRFYLWRAQRIGGPSHFASKIPRQPSNTAPLIGFRAIDNENEPRMSIQMSYHIPFDQRRGPQPIYIGFDAPPRPRNRWNWWAFFGFPLSLLGVVTAGVLSPIALLFNAIALRRSPRRLATAGFTISLLGTALLAGLIFVGVKHAQHKHSERAHRALVHENRVKSEKTKTVLATLSQEFASYRATHNGQLPNWIDANMITTSYLDGWDQPLRFDAEIDYAVLRSAGPDGDFDSRDDIQLKISGNSPRTVEAAIPIIQGEQTRNAADQSQ